MDGITSGICQSKLVPTFGEAEADDRLAKTLLLCNAKTVDLYRREFQQTQKGQIGITLVSRYYSHRSELIYRMSIG
jgi:hypothetical protein